MKNLSTDEGTAPYVRYSTGVWKQDKLQFAEVLTELSNDYFTRRT